MSLSTPDFWKLLADSRLLPMAESQRLEEAFNGLKGAAKQANAASLSEWLIAQRAITRYQATILLAGRSGPFFFGDYRVQDRIGAGRLLGLFRAVHVPSSKDACLFFLTGPRTQEPAAMAIAAQRVAVARSAVQPHLSQCLELVDLGGYKFVAVENLIGESVEERLAARGPISPADAARIVQQTALGLGKLHELAQPHGDIRPGNIWLDAGGAAKLLQTPLAGDPLSPPGLVDLAVLEQEGRIAGIADYLAPELAQPGVMASTASDVYALGCTFYQMLAGRAPFAGGDWRETLSRHAAGPLPPIGGLNPQWSQVLSYMTAKDARQRYQQAAQVVAAMESLLQSGAIPTLPASSTPPVENDAVITSPPPMFVQRPAAAPAPNPLLPNVLPAPTEPLRRPLTAKRNSQPYVIAGVVVAVVAIVGTIVAAMNSARSTPSVADVPSTQPTKKIDSATKDMNLVARLEGTRSGNPMGGSTNPTSTGGTPADPGMTGQPATPPSVPPRSSTASVIDDDGSTLWVSPTSGKPIQVRYVSRDSQIVAVLRPADLLAQADGQKVFDLGPLAHWAREKTEKIVGAKLSTIEQLTVALYPLESGGLAASFVVRFDKPADRTALAAAWGNPAKATHEGKEYEQGAEWCYYLPSEENGTLLVVAPQAKMQEIVTQGPDERVLNRTLERMFVDSDAQRHLTVCFVPAFLFGDGEPAVFGGPLKPLEKPLEWLLGGNARGALVSLHVGKEFFFESRVNGDGADVLQIAKGLRDRLDQVPGDLDKYLDDPAKLHNYGIKHLIKFPGMLRGSLTFVRSGMDDGQAVVRAVAPAGSAHNLLLGMDLLSAELLLPPPVAGAVVPTVAAGGGPPADSVAAKLQKRITVSFPRDTLEKCIDIVKQEIGVPIEIIGGDLQLEGITKNQSFGMDEKDKPAQEILQIIMKKANPDGKLVYVIKPKKPGESDMIFITTRTAAQKRGDKLP